MQIHGDTTRFGVHLSPQDVTYEQVSSAWRACEDLGFDWVSVWDHFFGIFGDPAAPCFEGPTLLTAMLADTSRIRCGIIVTGVTLRHPALVANMVATMDHVGGGRVDFGVGAAWCEEEHDAYGIAFPSIGTRLDMLDEACRVMRGLWTKDRFTFDGDHYRLHDAILQPKPRQERLPLMIGGVGERRALRIVAEHADIWNASAKFVSSLDEYRHKLDVLRRHCEDVGRPVDDVRKSLSFRTVLARTRAEAERRFDALPASVRESADYVAETPGECVERLRPFLELGVGDLIFGAMAPYDLKTIELLATDVVPALRLH